MTASATATYRFLQVEHRGPVTVLAIHRPDVLNALNRETLAEIDACAARFVDDPVQGALIVTGSGEKSFVSGADIRELAALDPRGAEALSRYGQSVVGRLADAPKPVIAAINGYAFGGGFELALACHMRFAADSAVMGLPEVGLGIIPGYGGTQRLPRLIGSGLALELILSGRRVKADEAERLGIVNRAFPREDLLVECEKVALAILKNGPLALEAALEAVRRGASLPLEEGLRFESGRFGMLAASADMHEGMNAFIEKRPPRFERR